MKRAMSPTFVAALTSLAWLGAADVDAAILFDDTAGGTAAITSASSSSALEQGNCGITFTVGSSGLTLTSAVFGLYGNFPGTASVGLRLRTGDRASGTGTIVQELAAASMALNTVSNSSPTTFTIGGAGWVLSANTQYTLAVFSTGTYTAILGETGEASGSWTQSGLTFNRFTRGSFAFAGGNFHIQLNGTVSAGAVPGTGFAAIATAGLAGVSRRRRR